MSQSSSSHFIHRIDYTRRERMVGAFVLIALGVIMVQLFVSGQIVDLFEDTREFQIELKNPIGVDADTKVRVSGLDVGWVTRVDLTERNTFVITLAVYDKFHALIREDSRASISKLAVVGDSVINISPGDVSLAALEDGARIETEEGMTMDDILTRLEPVLEQAEAGVVRLSELLAALPTNALPDILSSMQESAHNIEAMTQAVTRGDGSLGALIAKDDLSNSLQSAFDESNKAIEQGQALISSADANLNDLPILLEKLEQLIDTLQDSATELPELLDETEQLVDQSSSVVDSLSETWPISSGMQESNKNDTAIPALPAN